MSSSIPGMYPYQRLVMSGEYSDWFLNESPEVKETLYEIILEWFIKLGEVNFKGSQIDSDKMIQYLKKEFRYTGEYTRINEAIKRTHTDLRLLREEKRTGRENSTDL